MDLFADTCLMPVPDLTTARLRLRRLMESDLDDVTRYVGNFEVSKWLGPVPHPYTDRDAQEFLAMDRAGQMDMLWVITKDGAFAGMIAIGDELGYWSAPHVWGQGIMTEAGHAVLDHAFSTTDVNEIRSGYFTGNDGSRRVLEKLGFADTGPSSRNSRARNATVPARNMALTRADWTARQNG